MTARTEKKLRTAFSDSLVLEFDPDLDFEDLITSTAPVVVAGGDGTIGSVVRRLADSRHPVGLISLGTYNNFARALRVPTGLARAIEVAREGEAVPITLGRINDQVFLEAGAIGLFGTTIALGDSAKDRRYGDLLVELQQVVDARPFRYEISGDIEGNGACMSLVLSNTSTIGSRLAISEGAPEKPYLLLSIHVGSSRRDILGRALASALSRSDTDDLAQVFRFRKLRVTTSPCVRVYADNRAAGRTPATVTAEISALRVRLPA